LKKENPRFPFLVRECSGIQPNIYARYGMCYSAGKSPAAALLPGFFNKTKYLSMQ
jgi:hypothetical protein